ncbi:MAG TPA: hypothetical protein PLO25_02205 [Candidatus Saccharibacteria bacterium]|nr:hypothetical protein [Candidatus Saccharibacteria bacterium]
MIYELKKIFTNLQFGKIPLGDIPDLTAEQVLINALNIFYYASGVIAIIAILISAYYFVTSGGNQANVSKAKNTILYSVIGLIVIISAFAITNFVVGRF